MGRSRRRGSRARQIEILFAGLVIVALSLMPVAIACPYLIDLGDNTERRDTGQPNAVYATHRHEIPGFYEDHIHSYQWGWVFPTFTRTTFSNVELKKLEQRMDSEGSVGNLN